MLEKIHLFLINNAVLQRSSNKILNDPRLDNIRSEMDMITDSIVNKYISQSPSALIEQSKRMSEAYKIFFVLENEIRNFISDCLFLAYGKEWWNSAAPQSVQTYVSDVKRKESNEGLPPRSNREIDYTTFGQFSEIINQNWDQFQGLFSSVDKNRIIRVLSRLNTLRGPIAHNNNIEDTELVRLKVAVMVWYKLME